jgi:CheY-like chemotaxis protein
MDLPRLKILLVEDETLVAFLLEALLEDLGCRQVRHAASLAQGLAALDAARPDAAILDINLGGQSVFPLAERLEQAGVPIVFASGYGAQGLPSRWAGHPLVDKPYEVAAVTAALRRALAERP